MGNSQSSGFGVLNSTKHKLTICLSMGATHFWEENVMPGEIFYRWPGAAWYTVWVYPTHGVLFDNRTADHSFVLERKATDIVAACTISSALRDAGFVLDPATEVRALLNSYGITGEDNDREEGLFRLKNDVTTVFKKSKLEGTVRGLYGGGQGAWLEVTDLPTVNSNNGEFERGDIEIVQKEFQEIFGRGEFTSYSRGKYYPGS